MRKATIRDLRYRFRDVESMLDAGEEIQITKRKRVVAKLVPANAVVPVGKRPDFLSRLRRVYGNQPMEVSGAELVARERDRN